MTRDEYQIKRKEILDSEQEKKKDWKDASVWLRVDAEHKKRLNDLIMLYISDTKFKRGDKIKKSGNKTIYHVLGISLNSQGYICYDLDRALPKHRGRNFHESELVENYEKVEGSIGIEEGVRNIMIMG